MNFEIREMTVSDWNEVRAIYVEGIKTENSTFEAEAPSWEKWDLGHISTCRLVASLKDKVLGWVALSPVSSRSVYAGVAEVSVYISSEHRGKGIGKTLLEHLVKCSEKHGFWTLQASIFPENVASITIHKKCGFREIGRREKLGKMKNGIWRDVILLERRSKIVGDVGI
ncbi:GNAT family N-acetyltransferase [Tepidibacillus sp. HK-1]|uniref:GNAT family N-acetyltransferase n=1 Tax=Tepidibacillus sp. HK-1 TaxID=1883407 RepID=UPI000853BA81|nr:GNAT family N-acetyltransferase [Tepidibacillus sp. HK-1]GBF11942.1 phosphinothricin N-acetyltransferase [Tepidibacillus sp. HK-1]